MFVTWVGPAMSAQPETKGAEGSTSSSVAETEITWAAMPARVTATGERNPCPWIVTGVKGRSTRCWLLSIAVTWIAVTNRNALSLIASRPDVISWTRTVTFWFRFGSPARRPAESAR